MNASVRRCRPLLGTLVAIHVNSAPSAHAAHEAIVAAFSAVSHVHECMSFHAEASDTARLNRNAHRCAVHVTDATFDVLRFALTLSAASDGLFDITIAPTLMRWGFLPRRYANRGGTWRDIELADDRTVRFARPLAVDFGGIAKGYAVDQAAAILARHGLRKFVINAGGDLRIGDAPDAVFVRAPDGRAHPIGRFKACAVATSAPASVKRCGGHRVHPIVNPQSGRAADYSGPVSVVASQAMTADALTKIAAIAPHVARRLAGHYGARLLDAACTSRGLD